MFSNARPSEKNLGAGSRNGTEEPKARPLPYSDLVDLEKVT